MAEILEQEFSKKATKVLKDLSVILKNNPDLEDALLKSLVKSEAVARQHFEDNDNMTLYNAINHIYNTGNLSASYGNGWPVTIEAYLVYLDQHLRLVPNELPNLWYPTAWKSTGHHDGYNQKVFDLLAHFYWLIDQNDMNGKTVQSHDIFSKWLIDYHNVKGEFLDAPQSLTRITKFSFKCHEMYNTHLFSDDEENWESFNTFFHRQFNGADKETGISPLRPIAEPQNNLTIVAPADCTYKQDYGIDESGNVRDVVERRNIRISLKRVNPFGNIDELLTDAAKGHASDFHKGTFVHYFLNPFDYHRFHTPVKGKVLVVEKIAGLMYLDVRMAKGQFDAPDESKDGYEFRQARGLIIVDAGEPVGKVAILPIGMAHVSGVMMYKDLLGKTVPKGQEFGRFKFGGSDIIMLFQKPPEDLYFFKKDPAQNPIHFQYGQTAVYWNK